MTVDLTIPQDRANIFSDLRDIEIICMSHSCDREPAFILLFNKYWETASLQLWNLGYWNDYFRCGNIVLKVAKALNKIEEEAQLLSELGYVCMEWEQFEIAQDYFKKSLKNYQLINYARCQCRGLRYLGELSHRWGRLKSALKYYRKALDIVESQPSAVFADEKWVFQKARLSCLIGSVYLDFPKPNLTESSHELHLSLERFRAMTDKMWYFYQADPLLELGKLYFLKGDYDKTKQYYQECFKLSEEINRRDTMAEVLLHMAKLAEAEGKEKKALKLVRRSASVAGIEITSVRERAARYTERLHSKKKSS